MPILNQIMIKFENNIQQLIARGQLTDGGATVLRTTIALETSNGTKRCPHAELIVSSIEGAVMFPTSANKRLEVLMSTIAKRSVDLS